MRIEVVLLNSLAKRLPGQDPQLGDRLQSGDWTALRGERTAVQLALRWHHEPGVSGNSATVYLQLNGPVALSVSRVMPVPVRLPVYPGHDDNILTSQPGLIPDLLQALKPVEHPAGPAYLLRLTDGQWQVCWLELVVPVNLASGRHDFSVILLDGDGERVADAGFDLSVSPASLPPQTLLHTEWFHADCLADYYRVPVRSEAWWQIVGRFMATAAAHGVNLILTPIFTPPLDTAVGGERTTVQLVDVRRDGDAWSFDLTALKRWIDLARENGIPNLEIAHLFTQWGARATPKIMAWTENGLEKVFGWDTPADSPAYRAFLEAFLPRLVASLNAWGLAGRVYFHISDEPSLKDLASYQAARDLVAPLIGDHPVIDALSDFAFYQTGAVTKPIPANNHIEPFLEAQVPGLWTYYCCGQHQVVSNRFMAMPSARCRILGVQLYRYRIEGFLQWGYNFYNSQYSVRHLNPYVENDADGAFPAGDAFLVYPGPGGVPESSLRLKVFHQALNDLRALQLLESLVGRVAVEDLIAQDLAEPLTFTNYPKDSSWIIGLRRRVHAAVTSAIGQKGGENT